MRVPLSSSRILRSAVLASFYFLLTALKECCTVVRRLKLLRISGAAPLASLPGVSVIIPHHDDLEMLEACLASAVAAVEQVNEPAELLVVVNGASADRYAGLARKFPTIRWVFSSQLLGFAGAVRRGIEKARFDWVYLLNDDVLLDPLALREVLRCRGPFTFALASQIFPYKTGDRREETGYTFYRAVDGIIELDHRVPEVPAQGEKILYAGGGASLFHRGQLMQVMGSNDPYYPGYFEDAEWSVLAWKHGYQVVVCPESRVRHGRRITHQKLYGVEELDRVFERNACRFQLRNALYGGSDLRLCLRLWQLQARSWEELSQWSSLLEVLKVRARSYAFPYPLMGPEGGLPPFQRKVLARARRAVLGWRRVIVCQLRTYWQGLRAVYGIFASHSLAIRHAWLRRIRAYLVQLLLMVSALADRLGCVLRRRGLLVSRTPVCNAYQPGVSVVIPERANPALLGACLCSLRVAAARVSEPLETIVVVNGSRRQDYAGLVAQHSQVKWLFFKRPLWFCGAVRQGLKAARYDWVYLLNNDMVLAPDALSELLKWRAEHVYAVASQIYFKDPRRRREETGWTQFRWSPQGKFEIFDAEPEDPQLVRGTLYAGGGSSLFRRSLLKRFMRRPDPFHPFYWEDVEWGILAWQKGYEVLFCPASKVWHSHRATTNQLFTDAEIQRIFNRNGYRFQLRHPFSGSFGKNQALRAQLLGLDWRSLLELVSPLVLMGIVRSRIESHCFPFNEMPLQHVWNKHYFQPFEARSDRPVVVLVSPFALFPPAHGGAVRVHQLLSVLSSRYRFVLLSDEGETYARESWRYCQELASLHLVTGRTEPAATSGERIARIVSHSRAELLQQLRFLSGCYHPALVQIEFVELARLIEARMGSAPWVVTLHDVFLGEKGEQASAEDRYELELIRRFDAVVACSDPDAALLDLPQVVVVPNAVDASVFQASPPSEGTTLLFMGPFRYLPNLQGIQLFLERVYPRLLEKISNLELWILAGRGGSASVASRTCFRQPGVMLVDYTNRPIDYLKRCTVTVNPVLGIRGSSLKLLESLAAHRVCVSTIEGARGFLDQGWRSLVAVRRIEDMESPLEKLLLDPAYRHDIERLPAGSIENHTWQHSGAILGQVYERLMRGNPTGGTPVGGL